MATRAARRLLSALVALFVVAASAPARAEGPCGEDGGVGVTLSATAGVVAGATTTLVSTGILVAADGTRDFAFGTGAAVGIGVTSGLSLIYAVVDASTGCAMVRDQGVIAWTVPLTTAVLGTLLPIAVWGASDEIEPEAPVATEAALVIAPWGASFRAHF
jgi:hypothetical protein